MLLRGWPPTWTKLPATYTLFPLTARATTSPSAPGFQSVGTPVAASSAAMLLRGCPPTVKNLPPMYTVDPDATSPPTDGQILSGQYEAQQSKPPQQPSPPQGMQQRNSQ